MGKVLMTELSGVVWSVDLGLESSLSELESGKFATWGSLDKVFEEEEGISNKKIESVLLDESRNMCVEEDAVVWSVA